MSALAKLPEAVENAPAHTRAGLMVMNADKPLAQPGALQAVLERLDAGESTKEIANSLGISRVAINRYLLQHAPQQWKAIQSGRALVSIEDQDEKLDDAKDGVALGRVRERIGLAKWNLERVARDVYGDKQQSLVSTEDLADLLLAVSSKMLLEKQIQAIPVAEPQSGHESANHAQVIDSTKT